MSTPLRMPCSGWMSRYIRVKICSAETCYLEAKSFGADRSKNEFTFFKESNVFFLKWTKLKKISPAVKPYNETFSCIIKCL